MRFWRLKIPMVGFIFKLRMLHKIAYISCKFTVVSALNNNVLNYLESSLQPKIALESLRTLVYTKQTNLLKQQLSLEKIMRIETSVIII